MSAEKGPLEVYPVYDPMVACRSLDGEAVIVHSRTRRLHVLDEVGTFLWEAMAEGDRSLAQLIQGLVDEYDVDQATAEADVQAFLDELSREKLVRLRETPSS